MNSVSEADKAAYSFRRQLARQRTESETELKKRDEKIAELERRLSELSKPAETVKGRSDFETDDDYMDYIAGRKAKEAVEAERKRASDEKARAEAEARKAERADADFKRSVDTFKANIGKAFGSGERVQAFFGKVKGAMERGLNELIDADPVVSRFIYENEAGPAVLERIIDDRAAFERVMRPRTDPMERLFSLHRLADDIYRESLAAEKNAAAPGLPVIGKPGSGTGKSPSNDIFNSSGSLSDYIKSRRRLRR